MANKKNFEVVRGRICLEDSSRKYSHLGVFMKKDGDDYICLEHLKDGDKSIPVYLTKTEENISLVNNLLNPGDIINAYGIGREDYFVAERIELLSKSLKGRKSSFFDDAKKVRSIIKQKGGVLKGLRSEFEKGGFMEVSIPILMNHYEGGDANPFILEGKKGKKYYLKETNELILRKLLSAHVGKVYEIGRSFRNIGENKNSLNEFTIVESAIPYRGLEEGIEFSEGLLKKMIHSIDGKSHLLSNWERISFEEAFSKATGENYVPSGDYRKDRIDLKTVLENIVGPTYLVGLPCETSPINKSSGGMLREAVLVLDNSIFCDICEFDTDKESVEKRLNRQGERTGRLNKSFIDFMGEGIVPGVGVAFGLERWVQYLSGREISELKHLGGLV